MARSKKNKDKKKQAAAEEPQVAVEEQGEGAAEEVAPEETVEYWKDKFLRAQADIQNMRRRMMEETEERVRLRLEALLNDLIRVSDYMEAAMTAIPEPIKKAEQADAFLMGLTAIQQALEAVMLGHGMTFLAPAEGDTFDPDLHEAVENVVNAELEKPRLELLSRGYKMGKRILRPAKLRIVGPEGAASEGENAPSEPAPEA